MLGLLRSLKEKYGRVDEASQEGSDEKGYGGSAVYTRQRKASVVAFSRETRELDRVTLDSLNQRRKEAMINLDVDRHELDRLALLLRSKLHLRTHRGLVHLYDDSFRGEEAVMWLLSNSVVSDPEDGKNVMRHLLYRRIILRIDHTFPLFNSVLHSVAPDLADWRRRKQLQWYQESARKFSISKLYIFNVAAFSKFKLIVRIIQARGLRYTKHNHVTGKWEHKRIAPLASVSLGSLTAMTSVEEKTPDPVWEETFYFDFDDSYKRHEEIWIRVFDFREIGESFPLGLLCIPTTRIMNELGMSPDAVPSNNPQDAPGWVDWHPLVPPPTITEPEEVRGGELQLQFQIITNIADTPDETVHDECRPVDGELQAVPSGSRTGERTHDTSAKAHLAKVVVPPTVMKYEHFDRRSLDRARKSEQQPPQKSISTNDQNDFDFWCVHINNLEVRDVVDIQPGQIVWIEVVAKSLKRSEFLRRKLKSLPKEKKKDMEKDTGIIMRKRTPKFFWPKDRRFNVPAGFLDVPIPQDVAKYAKLEVRLYRRKEIPAGLSAIVGRGNFPLSKVRRLEKDAALEEERAKQEEEEEEEEATLEEETQSFHDAVKDSAHSVHSVTSETDEEKQAILRIEDFLPQESVQLKSPDAQVIVLRKQAAFKKNVRIKSGQILCYAVMKPMMDEEGDEKMFLQDDFNIHDGETFTHVDVEDALKKIVPDEDIDASELPAIDVPEPLSNRYVDTTVDASIVHVAMLLLGTNSKFIATFGRMRKTKGEKTGPWQIPPSLASESSSQFSTSVTSEEKDATEDEDEDELLEAQSFTSDKFQPITGSLSNSMIPENKVDSVSKPTREITFMLAASTFSKSSEAKETQVIEQMSPRGFVYTSRGETPHVPYGDRFYTYSQFVVTHVSPSETRVRISGEPRWKDGKGPPPFPIKGIIQNAVKSGQNEAYHALVKLLKDWVAPKRPKSRNLDETSTETPAAGATAQRSHLQKLTVILLAFLLLYLVLIFFLAASSPLTIGEILHKHWKRLQSTLF